MPRAAVRRKSLTGQGCWRTTLRRCVSCSAAFGPWPSQAFAREIDDLRRARRAEAQGGASLRNADGVFPSCRPLPRYAVICVFRRCGGSYISQPLLSAGNPRWRCNDVVGSVIVEHRIATPACPPCVVGDLSGRWPKARRATRAVHRNLSSPCVALSYVVRADLRGSQVFCRTCSHHLDHSTSGRRFGDACPGGAYAIAHRRASHQTLRCAALSAMVALTTGETRGHRAAHTAQSCAGACGASGPPSNHCLPHALLLIFGWGVAWSEVSVTRLVFVVRVQQACG